VVIVLGADVGGLGSMPAIGAFATPTIVHFSAVVLVSALVTMPWTGSSGAAFTVGTCGAAGLVYGLLVVRRARVQTDYVPELEDWIWHGILPLIAYGALLAAAIIFPQRTVLALFVIGATTLLLLFIGIHNAWDAVTYLARGRKESAEASRERPRANTGDAAS
jgi:hypothetical protein